MKIFFILIFSINFSWAIDFNKDIKSILSRNCFSCHGKDKQKGELRLDSRSQALNALSQNSEGTIPILERINHQDPDEIMPPPKKGKLSKKEKLLLEEWVNQGAKYGTHWSFTPPKNEPSPTIKSPWVSNDIDKFILQKLKETRLKPNDVKFDYKLLRRLSLILTGLPPSQDSYKKLLEGELNYETYTKELLDSKDFGEHMAVTWLDSARYGDTNGIQYDSSRPIWPYRDWVIKAFNDNMPYDQFLTEQIAGDLLPNSTISQKVATGFLRCNVTTNEMGSIEEEFKVRNAKDRLNTTMTTFTGLTVGCAECHDHKYDPLSQKEYYQMLAYFNNIDGRDSGFPYERSDPPLVTVLSKEKNEEYESILKQISDLESEMSSLKEKAKDSFWWWHYQTMASPPKDIYLIGELDSYFPFDEKSGSIANNLITEKRCNIKGPVYRIEGKYGKSLNFVNSTYIDCKDAGTFSNSGPFSIGFWLKPAKENRGTIIGKFDSMAPQGWKVEIEDGYLYFHMTGSKKDAIQVETESQIPIDQWTHIAVTYDGNSKANGIKIFINKSPVKTIIEKDNLKNDILYSNNMRIGVESHRNWLTSCSLDEVFTIKKELTNEEIVTIANFKSASRLALIPPNELSSDLKEELFTYYLKYHHKKYSESFNLQNSLKQKAQTIVSKSIISMVMKERKSIRPTFILDRGDYEKPIEKVSRKIPTFLNTHNKGFIKDRLGFAQWLSDKNHPLTARFFANRIWLKLMGKGLVRTPEDFGIQGDFPTHPELLDHLANYLVNNDWDIKKLVEYIISSSAFKQNSNINKEKLIKDPENKYLSFYLRRRMPAEMIRDNALVITELLHKKVGGKPVFPYQPKGLWSEATSYLSNTRFYRQSGGKDNFRRGIYTFWKRNLPPPSMTIFDTPNREQCIINRNSSNTPQQALALLNDVQFVDMYNWLAINIGKKQDTNTSKIKLLYQKIFYRNPSKLELSYCEDFLLSHSNKSNWALLISTLMNTDENISIE